MNTQSPETASTRQPDRQPDHQVSMPGGGSVLLRSFAAAVLALGLVLAMPGCEPSGEPSGETSAEDADSLASDLSGMQASLQEIRLDAPLNSPDAELSGLTWYGDTLVILPQYPAYGPPEKGRSLWGITHETLRRHLEAAASESADARLRPFRIRLSSDDLGMHSRGYEGCEAIAFGNGQFYVVTESGGKSAGMVGHLLRGTVGPGRSDLRLDPATAHRLPGQTLLDNMSYEAITLQGDTVVTLYEANGARVNPTPHAYRFDAALRPIDSLSIPAVEYRITDATSVDEDGRFWVINYFYPGEGDLLDPAPDSIALRDGVGSVRNRTEAVERLVEYRIAGDRIERTSTPAIWLRFGGQNGRNWEGIARFGDGFLLSTDRFPRTILAYVERQ